MLDKRVLGVITGGALVALTAPAASGGTIDFETADDFITPLVNGQDLETTAPFGHLFHLTTSGDNQGAAIFDTTFGVNYRDGDLWVEMGNALILQANGDTEKVPGQEVYMHPNDADEGGVFNFDFSPAGDGLTLNTLDVIDVDDNGAVEINLFDTAQRGRTIIIPAHFTGDIQDGGIGWATLDLASGFVQESPDRPGLFTRVLTDAGFDPDNIARMKVRLSGSGAIDNLNFTLVPVPAAVWLGLAGLGSGLALRRRLVGKA